MVTLYVAGQNVGTWADAEKMILNLPTDRREIELRDEAGHLLGRVVPPEPICPWDPSVTEEEIDRRIAAGGGIPLAEFWKKQVAV